MSYVPVDLFIRDTSPQKAPISGVVARIYSQDGKLFYTQVATDESGHVGLLLPESLTFQVRLFKFGVSFKNPWLIEVLPAPNANVFDAGADLVTPPVSADARLCVAYGHFRGPDGSAAAFLDIHFIPKFKPLLLDGSALLVERAIVRTDAKGYVELTLIRGGQYDVTIQGLEDMLRMINVPDAPNWNLPDLLFPVVSKITFDPPPPVALTVGQQVQITPTVFTSDGNIDDDGAYDVIWSSDDSTILGLTFAGGVLTLRGNAPGTANVIAVRADQSIVTIPPTLIQGIPLVVTVS